MHVDTCRRLSLFACGVVVLFLYIIPVFGQVAQFRHYTTDEGFTGAGKKMIVQDSLGFVWITSGGGLYRFDGYRFVNYKASASGDSLGFPMESPLTIAYADPYGALWIGLPDKLSFYDRDLDGFVTYRIPTNQLQPECLWSESPTVVWVATSGLGLIRFDRSSAAHTTYAHQGRDSLALVGANTIYDIFDEGSSLLLASADGIWRFDKTSRTYSRPKADPSEKGDPYY